MTDIGPALPRQRRTGRRTTLVNGLFGSAVNSVISLASFAFAIWLVIPLWHWAITDAVWGGTAAECNAESAGACWAFVAAKFRFIVFGFYPPDLQWRPTLVILLVASVLVISSRPRFWSARLVPLWLGMLVASWFILAGTFLPPATSTSQWGGLPITLLVALAGLTFAFPIAVLLAIARRSSMGIVRSLSIAFIEGLRGIPLIAVLYIAMLIVPMALPAEALLDKLLRAQVGITLFVSAYLAEVIRAGLQSVPSGQTEAAYSLGMGYWRTTQLVVLPQALRAVIPAVVNLSIGILLNTSLLAVIGISDVLNTAKTAATDPQWLGFYTESFVFVAAIYFAISFGASRYSLWLEARLRARR